MRSGGGRSGIRLTLTKGSSLANAGGRGGAASGVNDHDAIVTEWQDEQLQVKPRSFDGAGVAETAPADWAFAAAALVVS